MTGLRPGDLITHLGSTVDAVMTRSVLMYVPDKATAFRAMDRVLGYEVGPVLELENLVKRARPASMKST